MLQDNQKSQRYHLFQDQSGEVLVVEASPEALKRAPKNRLIRRMANETVSADRARMTLSMFGGVMIMAGEPAVEVTGRYSFG